MRRLPMLITAGWLVAGPALARQVPSPPPLPTEIAGQVDIAASTLGLIAMVPGAGLPVPAAPTASISSGCSNQPITHDAAIWSVLIYGTAVPAGGLVASPGTSVYTLPTHPGHVFVPVVDAANVPPVRVQLRDRVFTAGVTTRFGLLVITFGPMTLSDTGDFLDALENSTMLDTALQSATMSAQVFDFVDPMAPARRPDQFYEQELLRRLGNRPNPADFVAILQKAELEAQTFRTDLTFAINRASLPAARNGVRIMSGAAPPLPDAGQNPLFIIDEPCLQFSASPLVGGSPETSTAVSFRARYDFYNAMGRRFVKLRGEGDGSPSGSYYDRVEGTIDIGMNGAAARSVLSYGGTGSYSLKQESGIRRDAWRAVAKAQLQGPNLAGIFGGLPGAATSPLVSVEFGGAGGNALLEADADWIARTTAVLTGRFTTRLYLDLRGVAAVAGSPQFAGDDRFAYGSAQIRMNVNRDWDYLIKYECGRKDPDFEKFCGWQSGLALTLGR